MKVQNKLESFFNLPFVEIIKQIHWENQKSINWISNCVGVSRKSINNICALYGLKTRDIREATKLTKNRGKIHWAYGKNKDNSAHYKKISNIMSSHNPITKRETRIKAAKTRSEYFKSHPLPQELIFKSILELNNVDFIFQHPIGPFIIDFFIPKINLCVEIDSTNKWSKEKRATALSKDKEINLLGYRIIRINKNKLCDEKYILNILNGNNIVSKA